VRVGIDPRNEKYYRAMVFVFYRVASQISLKHSFFSRWGSTYNHLILK